MRSGFKALLLGCLGLWACDDRGVDPVVDPREAGTNDETHTEVAARVLLPDGSTPAAGAQVVLVPVQGTVAAARGQVDSSGVPRLPRVADGLYAFSASSGPLASWTDSVRVSAGKLLLDSDDTLRQASSITGVVALQPQHDPRTVTVNVLGTDAWANVASDGTFELPLLGAGVLRLRFSTSIPDYTPLYQSVPLPASVDFLFADTLRIPFTGIPVVTGLKAVCDSATGDIVLGWSTSDHPHLVDYVIWRDSAGAVEFSEKPIASTTDTTWRDTRAAGSDRALAWKYRVAVRVSGGSDPGAWYQVVSATSIPPALARLHEITWASLGAPGGSLVGFLGSRYASASLEIGDDSARLPVWSTADGSKWTSQGISFPLRKLGQSYTRAAGFAAGRLWCFSHNGIGDGVEIASTDDGISWNTTTIPETSWPGEGALRVIGSKDRIALVLEGATSKLLWGDSSGNWNRLDLAGRVLGLEGDGVWVDAGTQRIQRLDLATGREVLDDLGIWSGADSPAYVVPWNRSRILSAGGKVWAKEEGGWFLRDAPLVNALTSDGDQLLVRDATGTVWHGAL